MIRETSSNKRIDGFLTVKCPLKIWVMSAVVGAGLTIVGLAASTSSATANWQYTQWNMTPAEVKTASQGAAQDNSDRGLDAPNRKAQLTAPYQGEATPFKAAFLFNEENELKDVALTPIKKSDCPFVLDLLRKHYGQPKENSDLIHADVTRWDDFENSNLVVFLNLEKDGCTIQYSKLPNTHPDGNNL